MWNSRTFYYLNLQETVTNELINYFLNILRIQWSIITSVTLLIT
jgi:hypothetical protein